MTQSAAQDDNKAGTDEQSKSPLGLQYSVYYNSSLCTQNIQLQRRKAHYWSRGQADRQSSHGKLGKQWSSSIVRGVNLSTNYLCARNKFPNITPYCVELDRHLPVGPLKLEKPKSGHPHQLESLIVELGSRPIPRHPVR